MNKRLMALSVIFCMSNVAFAEDEVKYNSKNWENYQDDWDISDHDTTGGGNNELQYYEKGNITVDSDILNITLTGQGSEPGLYTSGKMVMKKPITYYAPEHGKMEVIMKLPKVTNYNGSSENSPKAVQGVWPAFWFLPTAEGAKHWANGGEVDIMEIMSNTPTNYDNYFTNGLSTLHFGNGEEGGAQDAWYKDDKGISHWGQEQAPYNIKNYDDWQIFTFEWHKINPDTSEYYWQMKMYLNDSLLWTRDVSRIDTDENNFKDFEQDKTFYNGDFSRKIENGQDIFGPDGNGDPKTIFSRALDAGDGDDGLHAIINLAFGGAPFPEGIDINKKTIVMKIKSIKIYDLPQS